MGKRNENIESLVHSLSGMFRRGDDEFDCSLSPHFVERLGSARMTELYRLFGVLAAEHGYDMREVVREGGEQSFVFSRSKREGARVAEKNPRVGKLKKKEREREDLEP